MLESVRICALLLRLSSSDVMERKAVWEKISALLRTYEKLYLTDQVFLLEAVEHVQFGQINTTASVVQKLVKDVMDPAHKYDITHFSVWLCSSLSVPQCTCT